MATPENVRKVRKILENKNKSVRRGSRGRLFRGLVHDIQRQLGLKSRKWQNCPKYSESQQIRAKTNCRKIHRNFVEHFVEYSYN